MTAVGISVESLTKRFGAVTAVDDLTFAVRPGAVTGFLGPNGSGKTTTLRMLLGLVRPTSGTALIGDRAYTDLDRPAQHVGAALEASSFHPGRTGLGHLRTLAPQTGVDDARCHELLELVGLDDARRRRVGGYSMGMRQRLGLATALLGDPEVIVLDEPANGLDPQGIVWLRHLLRSFAAEGRTVLVSSHVLKEVQSTVDDVVIITGGRLVHSSPLSGLEELAERLVVVHTPVPDALERVAAERGWSIVHDGSAVLVRGATGREVGAAAFAAGVELHQLADRSIDLEEVFLGLTTSPETATTPRAVA
ncbi:ATP-binding cassette domain-containing protein [Aeromicrobium sp. CF4.19]|uniref:ATP-binding cassette domain-containing protein n=1 Tax=Aeromicrobium sp. CF4.19 TaxID=3373082 RepID=UPI003EE80471